jgi:hypothetical protein
MEVSTVGCIIIVLCSTGHPEKRCRIIGSLRLGGNTLPPDFQTRKAVRPGLCWNRRRRTRAGLETRLRGDKRRPWVGRRRLVWQNAPASPRWEFREGASPMIYKRAT